MKHNSDKTGIYVHIPFCYKKCNYCDFYSLSDYSIVDDYFAAIKRNIALAGKRYGFRNVDSIFFGGGTPTSVDCGYIASVIDCLRSTFNVESDCEITVEANPATVDKDKLTCYINSGVNRISMGVQSASDKELADLSRIHDFGGFEKSYCICREMGIENINLDVMMGIPGQTENSLKQTLMKLVGLSPEHISVYMLSIEEGTPFHKMRNTLDLPSEDVVCDMYLNCHSFLEEMGYCHYEISNFAKQGMECRHNLKYWQGEDYISFGPAAHSFVDGVRYGYERNILKYINSKDFTDVFSEIYTVDTMERLEDEIIFGLRLSQGIDISLLDGYDSRNKLEGYIKKGYASLENGRLFLTPRGMLVSNSIISDILI